MVYWLVGCRVVCVRVGYGKCGLGFFFFFSSRRRHTRFDCDWSSDVCSSDLERRYVGLLRVRPCRCVERPAEIGMGERTAEMIVGMDREPFGKKTVRVGREDIDRKSVV